ncbi:MAG: CBS domain-containing protein [Legionellales bacterium]|nr:CBS domain-containing protein [Legionellales bacterium]
MFTKKKLIVSDVMLGLDQFSVLGEQAILKDAFEKMSYWNLGISCIVNSEKKLLGVLTDGDIRRNILKIQKTLSQLFVDDALIHAVKKPVTVSSSTSLSQAINLMEEKRIWDLPVVSNNNTLQGLLHLHPAIKALLNES